MRLFDRTLRRLVVAAVVVTPALTDAQSWYGYTCAPDGSVCATGTGTLSPDHLSIHWAASVTFHRVGAIRVIAAAITSPTAGIPGGGTDINAVFCCAATGTTLSDIYGGFLFTAAPTPGHTYFLPIGAMTLPAGDPRSAADLEAQLIALGFPDPSLAYPAFDFVGLRPSLASVAVSAVPEPATFALVGGGMLLVGAVARRRARA